MEKEDFIKKLFELYSNSFSKGNAEMWLENYRNALKPNYDYDKLYQTVIEKYGGTTAPKPAFLIANAKYVNTLGDKSKVIDLKTIIASRGNVDYEFGLNESFPEARYNLEKRGFRNVRYKFKTDNSSSNPVNTNIKDWVN